MKEVEIKELKKVIINSIFVAIGYLIGVGIVLLIVFMNGWMWGVNYC